MRVVKPADEMDAETFLKHINKSHVPIGGLPTVGKSNVLGDENEDLLRTYHERVHKVGFDNIGHGKTRPHDHYHATRESSDEQPS